MKRKLIGILSLMIAFTMLSACSGNDKTDATTAASATTKADATKAADKDSDATTAEDKSDSETDAVSTGEGKDTVIVGAAAEPTLLFPFMATNMDHVPILHNIYETPIRLSPNGEHLPLLAKSWDISADGIEYTLNLRDDVYFHNGDQMTAEDVAWTFNTIAPTPSGAQLLGNFKSAEATDEFTCVITLTGPNAAFLNGLAGRFSLIVNKKLYEEIGEEAYNEHPIGTGPYKFEERVSGDRVTLSANEDYWGDAPAVKNVIFRVMSDSNTQMIALESGDIDVLIRANVSMLSRMTADNVDWAVTDASSIAALGLNCASGPASDILFRQALQYGINREEINIGVFEGLATPGYIQIAPNFTACPDVGTYETIEYDLDKAKELLEQSSYNGEVFRFNTVSGTANESAAQIIQGQLIELGIDCQVNAVDSASYFAMSDAGEYDAQLRASGVSLVDADGLFFMYHSDHILSEGKPDMGVARPELDELIANGRSEVDQSKRKEIYAEAVNIITENALAVPLYYEVNAVAFNKELKGVEPHALFGLYYFNDWSW